MYWNESIECMSREQLREIQSRRLKKIVSYVYHNTPFYRKKFQEMDLTPDDIQSIDDITKLPFTNKTDLRDTYPFGLAAVPMSQIVRIHASSGTTGKPVVVLYTRKDLTMWEESISRAFTAYGATKEDIFQISYGYGLFTGGLGAHDGATNIGASVIPMSSGNTQKQITLMHDFGATALCCTPSYAMFLGEAMRESEWPREEFKLRIGAFGAEPWTENMRVKLEESLGIKAYDIYGLSEICGPGVGFECECQNGTHLNEDYFLPEIVNPETGEPLPEGQFGELCFTHLTKEGMPLLRYRTHDLSSLDAAPCACGRTHVRMRRVKARTDDMLIIRGVNVFPSQIEHSLLKIPGIAPQYQIVVDRKGSLDTIEVQVELDRMLIGDTVRDLESLSARIASQLASDVLVSCQVKLCQPGSLPRSEGKAKRVIDNRK